MIVLKYDFRRLMMFDVFVIVDLKVWNKVIVEIYIGLFICVFKCRSVGLV